MIKTMKITGNCPMKEFTEKDQNYTEIHKKMFNVREFLRCIGIIL